MDLVSIIIPVYNAQDTLGKCLDSCINQTCQNIEIVVINDGSFDESLKIALEYQAKDSRIKIFDQENHGQAFTRNRGLKNCNGKYVLFLDSDDWLERNAVEILCKTMLSGPSADFVLFGFNIYKKNKLIRTPNPGDYYFSHDDAFKKFIPIQKLMASPCNKFFKREYIKETFPDDMVYAEDSTFNYMNFKAGTNIICISDCLYNVRLNTTSGVNNRYIPKKLSDCIYSSFIEEEALVSFFTDIDVQRVRKRAFSSLMSIFITLAANTNFSVFCEEINAAYKNDYFLQVLDAQNSEKIHQKIFGRLVSRRRYKFTYLYCKILAVIRSIIINVR